MSMQPDNTREALKALLDRYTSLVNCGDCGNWDPETEAVVIKARAAIAAPSLPAGDGLTDEQIEEFVGPLIQEHLSGYARHYVTYHDGQRNDRVTSDMRDLTRAILAAPRQPAAASAPDGLTAENLSAALWDEFCNIPQGAEYSENIHVYLSERQLAGCVERVLESAAPRQPGEMGADTVNFPSARELYEREKPYWQSNDSGLVSRVEPKAASAQQDERAAFEAWAIEQDINITPGYPRGVQRDYAYMEASYAWRVWQGISKWRAAQQVQADAGAVAEPAFYADAGTVRGIANALNGHKNTTIGVRRGEAVRDSDVPLYTRPAAESDKRDATEATDRAIDQAYCDGAKFGWNCCAEGASVRFQQAINARRDAIRESRAAMSREQSGGEASDA